MDDDFEPLIHELDDHASTPRGIPKSKDSTRATEDANLKYLSRFQNPHLNKLLSALASDTPLHPERIRGGLSTEMQAASSSTLHNIPPGRNSPTFSASAKVLLANATDIKTSYKRSIRCATSNNTDSDQWRAQHEPEPSPPLSSYMALFSPSMFEAETPDGKRRRVFTFDANHISESTSWPAEGAALSALKLPHVMESNLDISNRPPSLSALLSPGRIGSTTRTAATIPFSHPIATSTQNTQFSPRRRGLTPRSPHPNLMEDKDFAELYDVAKEAGFFADTPRHGNGHADHRPLLHPQPSSLGSSPVSTSNSPQAIDLGNVSHHGSAARHVQFAEADHVAYSSCHTVIPSEDESTQGSSSITDEARHVSIPSITELDKVLSGSRAPFVPSQPMFAVPSPSCVGLPDKQAVSPCPLKDNGGSSATDSSAVVNQQQPLHPALKDPSSPNNACSGAEPSLPSIPPFLRSSLPRVPASFSPKRVKRLEKPPPLDDKPSSSDNATRLDIESNDVVESLDNKVFCTGIQRDSDGPCSDGQLSMAHLCANIVRDYTNIKDKINASRGRGSEGCIPSEHGDEQAIWIDPAHIESRYGVRVRNLQNVMNILEAVGLVNRVGRPAKYLWCGGRAMRHAMGSMQATAIRFHRQQAVRSGIITEDEVSCVEKKITTRDGGVTGLSDVCRRCLQLYLVGKDRLSIAEMVNIFQEKYASVVAVNSNSGRIKQSSLTRRLYDVSSVLVALNIFQKEMETSITGHRYPVFCWNYEPLNDIRRAHLLRGPSKVSPPPPRSSAAQKKPSCSLTLPDKLLFTSTKVK